MIRERIRKEKFMPFEVSGSRTDIRWGATPEFERVYTVNEETGERTFTGEMKETGYVTCIHERYMKKPPFHEVRNAIIKGKEHYDTYGTVSELRRIAEGFGMEREQLVSFLKEMLIAEIRRYDKSEAVEDLSFGGVHMWLDSNKRTKVWENLMTAQQKGEENVVLRDNGLAFPMTVETGWQLYYAVLDYARATWNVTESHIATVNALTTADELEAYDYTLSYPEKLAF